MSEAICFGIGSVVSPVPRLINCTFGCFLTCSSSRLLIYIYINTINYNSWHVKYETSNSKSAYVKFSIKVREIMKLLRETNSCSLVSPNSHCGPVLCSHLRRQDIKTTTNREWIWNRLKIYVVFVQFLLNLSDALKYIILKGSIYIQIYIYIVKIGTLLQWSSCPW